MLSGEIRKPGSFSLTAIRIISEIDSEIASAFQEIADLRFEGSSVKLTGEVLLKPKLENATFAKWVFLEEIGLLQGVQGNTAFNVTLNVPGEYFVLFSHGYYLRLVSKRQGSQISIPIVMLTRAGHQIASILPRNDFEALRTVGKSINDDLSIEIGRVLHRTETAFQRQVVETIKP